MAICLPENQLQIRNLREENLGCKGCIAQILTFGEASSQRSTMLVGRWLAAAENKRYEIKKRREINPRPTERCYEKDIFVVP